MTQPINDIIHRMKNLKEFIISVDLPDGLQLNGVMPYDVNIQGNRGRFKVYALTKEEAQDRITEYLGNLQWQPAPQGAFFMEKVYYELV